MILSELTADEVADRLRGRGLAFACGPFLVRVVSPVPAIARMLRLLYADHPLADSEDFADFHLELKQPRGLRRWVNPLVAFNFDGTRPFHPVTIGHAYPLFEWALNWCVAVHAHQYLMLHAAVIERNGRVAVIPGPPGTGKSTLTAALVSRGWRLFSDEMALIDIADRSFVPLPRPISLKNQSLDIIGRFVPGAVFGEVTHNTAKGTIAHMKVPSDHVRRAAERARGGWIVFPSYVAGAQASLRFQSKAKAFMELGRNSFNYNLQGTRAFDIVGELVEESACYAFEYGDLDDAVKHFDAIASTAHA